MLLFVWTCCSLGCDNSHGGPSVEVATGTRPGSFCTEPVESSITALTEFRDSYVCTWAIWGEPTSEMVPLSSDIVRCAETESGVGLRAC